MNYNKIIEYLNSLNQYKDQDLEKLKLFGIENSIPIVTQDVGLLLHILILIHKPKNILEIGFGGGYSTLWMAKAIEDNVTITSLELNTDRIAAGKSLFDKLNMKHKLKLVYADALKYLDDTKDMYDFIFLDAIKRSYMDYIPKIEKVLKKGGILIADNILFKGRIIEKEINHKYYTGVSVIKEFNKTMANLTKFKTIFIPTGDGISLSVKIV